MEKLRRFKESVVKASHFFLILALLAKVQLGSGGRVGESGVAQEPAGEHTCSVLLESEKVKLFFFG